MLTAESVQNLWNNWEIRVLVLISLTLQLFLFHFGRQRRCNVKTWIHIFLWLCYLVADSVATVALGVISSKQRYSGNDSKVHNELMTLWAPLMLLHLGGQDTITAYAMQDNELWLRHLLVLIVQSSVAFYIFITSLKVSLKDHWLSLLTIPMLVAGFIKYAERIFVMRLANYTTEGTDFESYKRYVGTTSVDFVVYGTFVKNFPKFRPLFQNQKMALRYAAEVKTLKTLNVEKVFKTIEIYLGLAYDDFYTKAPLFSKAWVCIFRCITFSSTVLVFVFFHFFAIDERHKHLQTDLIITYILLSGALVIEIYAVILLIASDMAHLWLHRNVKFLQQKMTIDQFSAQKWSNTMGQFNMLSFGSKNPGIVLQGTPKLRGWFFIHILPKLKTELEMLFYKTNNQISDELKKLVWDTIRKKEDKDGPGFSEDYNQYLTSDKSVNVDIDDSIIIWHLATEICFTDNDNNAGLDRKRGLIKEISHYMMYILAFCPFMFSVGSAKVTFQKSCSNIQADLRSWRVLGSPMPDVVKKLETMYPSDNGELDKVKDHLRCFSFLPCAYAVAQKLREKEEQKWKILIKFWVENLARVAILCQGNNHAQQLRKGGEFLSHVWLLIEHMDLKEKFRVPLPVPQQGEQTLP